MPLTAAESKRADQLEAIAKRRDLTREELAEYHNLALASHQRAIRERIGR